MHLLIPPLHTKSRVHPRDDGYEGDVTSSENGPRLLPARGCARGRGEEAGPREQGNDRRLEEETKEPLDSDVAAAVGSVESRKRTALVCPLYNSCVLLLAPRYSAKRSSLAPG